MHQRVSNSYINEASTRLGVSLDTIRKEISVLEWVYDKPINKPNRKKIGLLIAGERSGRVEYGWSLCKKTDIFNAERAFTIAYGRFLIHQPDVPFRLQKHYNNFQQRCSKYFKEEGFFQKFFTVLKSSITLEDMYENL